jgi:hypothetical protein
MMRWKIERRVSSEMWVEAKTDGSELKVFGAF